jgi:hypothetical protein
MSILGIGKWRLIKLAVGSGIYLQFAAARGYPDKRRLSDEN